MKNIRITIEFSQDGLIVAKNFILNYDAKKDNGYVCHQDWGDLIIPLANAEEVYPYYFTFMQKQEKKKKKYLVIYAVNENEALKVVRKALNEDWASCYDESEWHYTKGSPMYNTALYYGLIDAKESPDIVSQADVYQLTEVTLEQAKVLK